MKDLFPDRVDKTIYRCDIQLSREAWKALQDEAARRGCTGGALISALLEAWAYKPATTARTPKYTAPLREADRILYRDDEPLVDLRDEEG